MGSDWLYLVRLSALLLLLAGAAGAQAGPPFRTDDPETPGNKHWEINFGFLGDRNPSEGYYSIPDFDINYGLGDRIQLKYELPIAVHDLRGGTGNTEEIAPTSQAHVNMGLGQSLLGIKWRFYQDTPAPSAPYAEDAEPPKREFLHIDLSPALAEQSDKFGSSRRCAFRSAISASVGSKRTHRSYPHRR
jgi:hypothetical protein